MTSAPPVSEGPRLGSLQGLRRDDDDDPQQKQRRPAKKGGIKVWFEVQTPCMYLLSIAVLLLMHALLLYCRVKTEARQTCSTTLYVCAPVRKGSSRGVS